MAVVFDGWTSPLAPSDSDFLEIKKDTQVMEAIIKALPSTVTTTSVIGCSSSEKIMIGSVVDFYITNWLQGSLHVDNICRKKGVGHFNRYWQSYDKGYYHYSCLRIQDNYIEHEQEGRADLVSYNIPWQRVYEALLNVLKDTSLFELRALSLQDKDTIE